MQDEGSATLIQTSKHIHILCGVSASDALGVDGSIPSRMLSFRTFPASPSGDILAAIVTENPMNELLNIRPDNSNALIDNNIPKAITLAGKIFPPEKIISVKTIPLTTVRPQYTTFD
jgi:hypothetical protein